MKLLCKGCGKWLEEPGALLFSPPLADWTCSKHHICKACFATLETKWYSVFH